MIEALSSHPVPDNEAERLALLHDFKILGTAPDAAFDEICEIVKEQLELPIVLISLADRNRHWFKACSGIDLKEVPRETSFCTYTILNDMPLVLDDAQADARFADNPFVTGPPHVRFYAGVPLLVRPGLAIGSLCGIDVRPRRMSRQQISLLQRMAKIVMAQMHHHKATVDLAQEVATRRRRAERIMRQRATLNRQRRFAEQSADLAGIGGWSYDVAERQLTWSRNAHNVLGLPADGNLTLPAFLGLIAESDRERVERIVGRAIKDGGSHDFECHVGAPGEARRMRITCEADKANGGVLRLKGTLQDVTNHYERRKQVEQLARFDALTGLPNRVALMDALDNAVRNSAESGAAGALLLADLDRFKTVNDTLGHDAGDFILRTFAERMQGRLRDSDAICRLGGDEFAMVLHDVKNVEGAHRAAQQIIEAGTSPFVYGDQVINIGISVGIRMFTGGKLRREQILKDADIALYNAKSKGRNCAVAFHKNLRQKIEERQSTLLEVRSGLETGEFDIHFQPQIALVDNQLMGFEVLLRWNHPTEGCLSAAGFAAALADFKLSRDLSNFALEAAVSQMSTWAKAGLDFGSVAVNVSHSQLAQPGFADRVIKLLDAEHLPPSSLTVEVVEDTVMARDVHNAVEELTALSNAGVIVAIDDFGTGYASLIHLKKFPIRQIKIDGSFIDNVDRDLMGLSIVKSIIDMADSLKLKIVAEGVERTTIANLLRQCGCHGGQGYLWSPALNGEEATDFLRDMRRDRVLSRLGPYGPRVSS
ncbi:MAG TPA: sensor domain-containing phosphodiesterase [Aestuariivirgaceae bacterium]|nr:sensor domain-containing phosphodiesterase [Aestuariivirgaceae bacterium]